MTEICAQCHQTILKPKIVRAPVVDANPAEWTVLNLLYPKLKNFSFGYGQDSAAIKFTKDVPVWNIKMGDVGFKICEEITVKPKTHRWGAPASVKRYNVYYTTYGIIIDKAITWERINFHAAS